MPHTLIKIEGGKISALASSLLADAQIYATNYANQKIEEEIKKFLDQCPPPAVLESIARTVDRVESLEQTFQRRVDKVAQLPKKLDKPIKLGKIVIDILTHVLEAKFTTIGVIPPTGGPVPGVLIPERLGRILTQASRLEDAKKIVFTLEDEKKGVESLVSGVQGGFTPLSGRLQRLKDLLERCALDPNLSKEERDKILNNKLKKDDSSLLEAYTGRNGRVYEIDIIDVLDNDIDVPRRQAIAKDFRGVVVLRGQPSYSSNPQVLKDELKFRIDNQLP
jgi:hypothetical protein